MGDAGDHAVPPVRVPVAGATVTPYYEHGGIVIYHEDCRNVLPLRCDVLVFDPPYGINWRRGVNAARNSKAHTGIVNDGDTSARDWVLETMPDVPAIVFGSFYAPQPANMKQVLVWHKPSDAGVVGSVTGYRRDAEPIYLVGPWPVVTVRWSGVLRSASDSISAIASATGHPHTKPEDLMRQLIGACPDGVVLDPFMGSGSTLVAAKLHGRKAIGIDIDERYCEIAAMRLQQDVLPLDVAR
jgi:site-specific DNA-methyltransferase (adenine-specific)